MGCHIKRLNKRHTGQNFGYFGFSEEKTSNIPTTTTIQVHRTSVMREFSASRHFFKTNMTQSVAELILYSQKNIKLW